MRFSLNPLVLSACSALLLSTAVAANQIVEQIPPVPSAIESDDLLEPSINILQTEQETIYEYRVNGEIFAIKVQPKQGAAYYFYDRDGDGELEFTRDDPLSGLAVNQWVLLRW